MNPWNLFAVVVLPTALFLCPFAQCQEAAPATLATLPARLDAIDKEFATAVAAAQKALEVQIAAGRIKDPAAQSLRWSLKNAAQNITSFDSRTLVNTAKVPSDNEELRTAISTLESAIGALQGRRSAALKEAHADIKPRVAEMVRTAERPEQVEPLQAQVEALREAGSKGSGNYYSDGGQQTQQASMMLSALQRVLAAEREGSDPRVLSSALGGLRGALQGTNRLAESEVQARIERTVKPVLAAADAARQALEKSLIDNQTPAQTAEALARYEEAAARASAMRSNVDTGRDPDESRVPSAYRILVQAQAALAKGDTASARRLMENAQSTLDSLTPAAGGRLREWTAKWKTAISEKVTALRAELMEKIRARLGTIKSAEELEKFAAELSASALAARKEGNDGTDESWISSLAQELGALGQQWTNGSVFELAQSRNAGISGDGRPQLTREIAALRTLAERESWSRSLRAPELLQPPLLSQPLDIAIETLCDDLAKRIEWRRLYRLIESRGVGRRMIGYGNPADPTLQALQSFFAAQNFELAEQWSEAVASYKAVLKNASERIPVKETSERLKVLKKEHPEAFETAPAAKSP